MFRHRPVTGPYRRLRKTTMHRQIWRHTCIHLAFQLLRGRGDHLRLSSASKDDLYECSVTSVFSLDFNFPLYKWLELRTEGVIFTN